MSYKRPESILVVIYAKSSGRVLMLQRRDDTEFWQSVTGSLEQDESPPHAQREVMEEVGIDIEAEHLPLFDCQRCVEFELFVHLRHRYAPGTTCNKEHWFCLALPEERDPVITEHHAYQWLEAAEAVKLTKSWSNQQAIEEFVINSVQ